MDDYLSRIASVLNGMQELAWADAEACLKILDAAPKRWKSECIGFDEHGRVTIVKREKQ